MRRAERRCAEKEHGTVRSLFEIYFLLGVAFRYEGLEEFLASTESGVPKVVELGKLLQVTERIQGDEETDEYLLMIFAPGSLLGGARPKASVIYQ